MDAPQLPRFTAQFDPEAIVTMMKLWRDAVDLRIPLRTDMQPHFLERRKHMLYNFESQGRAWRLLLQSFSAEGSDVDGLDQLRRQVDDFWEWADEGLTELEKLALELAESNHDTEILADPLLESHIRKLRRGPPEGERP
ncbi:hypothetical protein [Variovorax paradoxus]|uniref:hypothetical protein n=1 Tax=Variovorax paradoxus TaxID=34073 RepID=UPI001932BEFB|nr:hypothetical protein INQ48_43065 [Variovorax paradoxus]